MATVESKAALRYALSREMFALYGVIVLGYVALVVGTVFRAQGTMAGGGAGLLRLALALVVLLASTVAT